MAEKLLVGESGDWLLQGPLLLTDGFRNDLGDEELPPTALTRAENVIFDDNALHRDSGYEQYLSAVIGTSRVQFLHKVADGTAYNLMATNTRFYIQADVDWEYVSNGTSTTTTSSKAASATTLDLTSASGFSDGDPIGVRLDDGTQHRTTVNGAPAGNTITLTDALPSAASAGVTVIVAAVLTGTDEIQCGMLTVPWDDKALFWNGVDPIKVFDPSATSLTTVSGIPSGDMSCRTCAIFDNSVMVGYTVENGTTYRNRVRSSDKGDYTNWTTGDSSRADLYDSADEVMAIKLLGPYLSIYRRRSISRCAVTTSPNRRFNYEKAVSQKGIVSQLAVVDIGDEHIILSDDNLYLYSGGFDIEPIGDKVNDYLFGTNGNLNISTINRVMLTYIRERHSVIIFFTKGSDGTAYPKTALRYYTRPRAYTVREFPHNISGLGFHEGAVSPSWNTTDGDWTEQVGTWESSVSYANTPILVLGTDNLGAGSPGTFEYDFLSSDDNGTEITGYIETKDFGHPSYKTRIDFLEMKAANGPLTVSYSIDGGVSWNSYGMASPDATPAKVRIYKQVVGPKIRFRFQSTSGFSLYWYSFKYRLESEW